MTILKQKTERFWKCSTGKGIQKHKTEEQKSRWNAMPQVVLKRRVQHMSSRTRLRPECSNSMKREL